MRANLFSFITLCAAALLLLLTGCFAVDPYQAEAGGGQADPTSFAPPSSTQVFETPMPAPTMVAGALSEAPVRPGWSTRQNGVTFTLVDVQTAADGVKITYNVLGLPANYKPAENTPDLQLLLPDGRGLKVIQGATGAGGMAGSETGWMMFEPLPQDADNGLLTIVNNWSTGAVQTWKIPISFK